MSTAHDWLAETKLRPPLAQAGAIERAILPALVAGVRAHRVTLLSAPAGYGKTSLLASLARTPGLTVAWYAVDEEDDEPGRLVRGLGRAVDVAVGTGDAPDPSPAARPLDALVARLETLEGLGPDPLVLVLDDLHLVTAPGVHAELARLVERMPPRVRLVVAARFDPPLRLARLRAARELFELRPADLRMTADEARRLLLATMGRAMGRTAGGTAGGTIAAGTIAADELDRIGAPAEGWPAGLVLLGSAAGASAQARPTDPASGRDRRLVFEFLAEEVLALQPPDLRRFLLETSILPELTPARCDAVTGRPGSRAVLEELLRRNLFLVELDAAGDDEPVCRHHALFAEFLRGQLRRESPSAVAALQRRAAAAEPQPVRAVDHWLAAGAWNEAAAAIERLADGLILAGRLATLLAWLAALPDAAYHAHPRLVCVRAIAMVQRGDPAGVPDVLAAAGAEAARTGDALMAADIACAGAAFALIGGDFAACASLVGEAAAAPERRPATDVLLAMLRASLALFAEADPEAAASWLHRALAAPAATADREAALYVALLLGPEFTVLPGALDAIERFCALAGALPEAAGGPIGLGVDDVMAPIHLRRGRLDEAVAAAARALDRRGELGGYLFLGFNAALAGAMAHAARGEAAAARALLDRVRAASAAVPLNRAIGADGAFPSARLAWLDGRPTEAREALARLEAAGDAVPPFLAVLRESLRAMLAIAVGDHAAAEALAREAVRLERGAPVATIYASADALLARVLWLRRRPREAVDALAPLLRSCAADGTPGRVLVEAPLVRPVLRAAVAPSVEAGVAAAARAVLTLLGDEPAPGGSSGRAGDRAAAPLSDRELEVVRLIADGASNAEIADRLSIGVATVKSHVGHAMDKLDAASRTQVVARARAAGLLDGG